MSEPGPRAVVVGGSLSGLCAGLTLTRAGWAVTIIERAPGEPPGGAGLGLDRRLLGQVTPMTGAGFENALLDVAALAAGLRDPSGAGVPAALGRYEQQRLPFARQLVSSGMAWGRSYLSTA